MNFKLPKSVVTNLTSDFGKLPTDKSKIPYKSYGNTHSKSIGNNTTNNKHQYNRKPYYNKSEFNISSSAISPVLSTTSKPFIHVNTDTHLHLQEIASYPKKLSKFDYIQVIPKGNDCVIYFKNNKITFYKQNSSNQFITAITDTPTNLNNTMALGTIIQQGIVVLTDIIYLNGEFLQTNKERIRGLYTLFKEHHIQTHHITTECKYLEEPYDILFSISDCFYQWNDFVKGSIHIPYEIKHLEYKFFTENLQTKNSRFIYILNNKQIQGSSLQNTSKQTFLITADVQADVYYLSDVKNGKTVDTAHIPDYKTSVMMNSIFRNIKENRNLDSLEESDDDEDFEDCREDKYLQPNKRVQMECVYNTHFNKWVPNKIL